MSNGNGLSGLAGLIMAMAMANRAEERRIKLGEGISISLESALTTDSVEAKAFTAVSEGGILRIDAVKGDMLGPIMGSEEDAFADGSAIDPDGWYGVVPIIGIAVGPFDRKSQAMNGLVLALMGVDVKGERQPKPSKPKPEPEVADRPTVTVDDLPPEVAKFSEALQGMGFEVVAIRRHEG